MVEFQIVLDENWNVGENLFKQSAKVVSEPKEVKEPVNFINKLKKKLGLNYKEKVVGYYYKIELNNGQ